MLQTEKPLISETSALYPVTFRHGLQDLAFSTGVACGLTCAGSFSQVENRRIAAIDDNTVIVLTGVFINNGLEIINLSGFTD